jgi:hypothetical protein
VIIYVVVDQSFCKVCMPCRSSRQYGEDFARLGYSIAEGINSSYLDDCSLYCLSWDD